MSMDQLNEFLRRAQAAQRAVDELGAGRKQCSAPIKPAPRPPKCNCEDWCGQCDLRDAPPGVGLS